MSFLDTLKELQAELTRIEGDVKQAQEGIELLEDQLENAKDAKAAAEISRKVCQGKIDLITGMMEEFKKTLDEDIAAPYETGGVTGDDIKSAYKRFGFDYQEPAPEVETLHEQVNTAATG